jgi:DNA-binding NarL/FixJ family response regulator
MWPGTRLDRTSKLSRKKENTMIKTTIYSTQPIPAMGLQGFISGLSGFDRPGVCPTWDNLLNEAQQHSPDHLIIIDMTPAATIDRLAGLTKVAMGAKLILWTETIWIEFLSQAIALGLRGILRKGESIEFYSRCLRTVASGEIWMEAQMARMVQSVRRTLLTPRERELVALVAQGLRIKEVASRMGITDGTVKVYLSHLYAKVGASGRYELARIALKNLAADQADSQARVAAASNGVPLVMPRYLSVDCAMTN